MAKGLQDYLLKAKQAAYAVVSIDDFLNMAVDTPIYEDNVYEVAPRLCEAVKAHLHQGQGVILDHVITSERIYSDMMNTFYEFPVAQVHVTCPLSELKKREARRSNRCAGSAQASFEYLFPKDGYALTIDTSSMPVERCYPQIAALLS